MLVATTKQEFLTFILGKEEFGVEIQRVQEIRGWEKPRPLPNVPVYVKGVIDLRGTVVPIIDLRERFKLPASYGGTTVVIVVHVITSLGERIVGLVVDAVSDVHSFDMSSLQPPPDISASLDNQFMLGLTSIKPEEAQSAAGNVNSNAEDKPTKSRMVILVDLDKLASDGLIEKIDENEEDENLPVRNG
ncbi:chemotaxis protein CheW [Thiomicrorhabdus sediminis]|uniref:Chemotaxis protein CheW n=1 Tax=Thiomicrorhabdus sediminis TaxID=2580412 RepID=A0A4P9K5C6_9GAMM|nr:chemotaxis protein CheW [Thiomicrorhabdus sediminis]QCU89991.1 purine-binding chemotaxis protein CheW [Thiomicrorhabdus sediminis]